MLLRRLPLASSNRQVAAWHATSERRVSSAFASIHGQKSVADVKGVEALNSSASQALVWNATEPLVIRHAHSLPAMKKWFMLDEDPQKTRFGDYISLYENAYMPYEFSTNQTSSRTWLAFLEWLDGRSAMRIPALEDIVRNSSTQSQDDAAEFHQLQAPLRLLIEASQYNSTGPAAGLLTQLYIAQSDIRDLPEDLSNDLPAPELVRNSPKGDVYSSSVWLGLQPTYTPLHRDPNPNIFCQLHGHKTVRFIPNGAASDLYRRIQRSLGNRGGHATLRGTEMMQGPERSLLHKATWQPDTDESHFPYISEATLGPGDALYIPTGWWHTFVSQGCAGSLNASANWWCR